MLNTSRQPPAPNTFGVNVPSALGAQCDLIRVGLSESMSLDTLPAELLQRLPYFVDSIEDILSLSSTCRALYHTCANPSPKLLSRLVAESGRIFFRPHPHMIIAATARQLANWAIQQHDRRVQLEEAIRGGVDKLAELAVSVVGLTMDDIRRLLDFKYTVLNPLNRQLDLSVGPSSDEEWTVCNDPETTLLTWVIYGELFHHSTELGYLPFQCRPLTCVTRYKWFTYCVPDVNSFEHLDFQSEPEFFKNYDEEKRDKFQQLSLQTATDFLRPQLWEEALQSTKIWKTMNPALRPTFVTCAMHLGFGSLQLLVPGGPNNMEDELESLAANLAQTLKVTPRSEEVLCLIEARNKELHQLVNDPWWLGAIATILEDVRFTLSTSWPGDADADTGPLIEAIRNPAQKATVELF